MEEKNGRKKKGYLILTMLFILLAVLSLGIYVSYHLSLDHQEEQKKELEEAVIDSTIQERPEEPKEISVVPNEEAEAEKAVDLSIYDIPEKELNFAALREKNEDIYAWIYIPDTHIDDPVLQHPTELDYYLDYNIDGSKGYPGCIYTQYLNSKEWDDFNTVLYGHNMKNGTMFHDLHYYEDSEFFDAHPYVYIYTEDGPLVYQIFAAYEFSNIHLLMGFNLDEPETREIYLDNIYASEGLTSNFNEELSVGAEDHIITLSTCISNKADRRYMVAAVLVADGRTSR